jgi:hypothetical protein
VGSEKLENVEFPFKEKDGNCQRDIPYSLHKIDYPQN